MCSRIKLLQNYYSTTEIVTRLEEQEIMLMPQILILKKPMLTMLTKIRELKKIFPEINQEVLRLFDKQVHRKNQVLVAKCKINTRSMILIALKSKTFLLSTLIISNDENFVLIKFSIYK
jgi:hypothetical protein